MASSFEGFQVMDLDAYSSLNTSYRRLTPSQAHSQRPLVG